MSRSIRGWLLVVAVGTAWLAPGRAVADDSVASHCPGYAAHLVRAKDHLSHGDQKGALQELQSAREALSACIREEADQSSDGSLLG